MWDKIEALKAETGADIRALIKDEALAARKRITTDGMLFDFGKTSITDAAWSGLLELAADVPARRVAMFRGEKINTTESRAVLHTALRAAPGSTVMVDGENVISEVEATRARMAAFAQAVRDGAFVGEGGKITDVVNIGIGGSDLGPAMAARALSPYCDGPRVHFVANIDGADIADTLKGLDPGTTLIIVASKTFTTIETMTNAQTARDWMGALTDPGKQFAAVSTAAEKVAAFGIPEDQMFGFADWVGGRYSVWGPIGLALMIAIGPEAFDEFLAGARAMDDHFCNAPLAENIPVALALVGIWHHQVCGYPTRAVLPYDQRLSRLPAYLQQLEMESNGKSICHDGTVSAGPTGPVVWGEPGTNGQHAFYQLMHQGTTPVPAEFLLAAQGHEDDLDHQHQLLMANCLAQGEALMQGRSAEDVATKLSAAGQGTDLAAHRSFPGNRPSTLLLYPKLTPFALGQIIAAYEHRVFVEGVILNINSYDQWGVELGKEMALALSPYVSGKEDALHKDPSTRAALEAIHTWRREG